MTVKELRSYIPFTGIRDGFVISRRGDITCGWKVWLPTAYSVNEAGYDSIINSFIQAYKLLPVYCIIHKQDIFRYDRYHAGHKEFFLADCYEKHFEGRTYLNGYSYMYLTFSTKKNIEHTNAESAFFGTGDFKELGGEYIRQCALYAEQFESVLNNNSLLRLERMTDGDFLRLGEGGRDEGVIPDYLRMYESDGPDYNLRFSPDRVVSGDSVMKVWYVEDSDAYPSVVSSVSMINEMSSASSRVFLSGGSPIGYRLRIPHIVNRYVVTLPRKSVEQELDKKKRLMNSFSLYSSSCKNGAMELQQYLDTADMQGTHTIKCFMDVMAWGRETEVNDMRNKIVTAFSDLDVYVVEETRVAPLLHYAAIPGAAPELGYDNYITSELTAFLCHGLWDGYDNGMKGGLIHVCDRNTMIPKVVDIQSIARERGYISNMNAVVVGPSGSGKSFTMNSLVQDFYVSGEHTLIIDVGDSYQGLCSVINEESGGEDGIYNTYDPEHPFGFNPFRGRQDWDKVDSDGDKVSSGSDFIFSLLQTMYIPEKGWDKTASSVLNYLLTSFLQYWDNGFPEPMEEDLKDAFANERRRRAMRNHKRFDEDTATRGWKNPVKDVFPEGRAGTDPLFDDFFQYVSRIVVPLIVDENFHMGDIVIKRDMFDAEAFVAAMDLYKVGGQYGFLLNQREEADLFRSRMTVFEVDKIKNNEELFPLWLLCIMHSFEEKMRSLSCQKVIVIEEAWSAIAKPTMANFIVWMWRTARKFRTSAVVVTQSVTDLTSSPIIKDAIIQNTDVKILLDQRRNVNNFQNSAQVLGMSQMAVNMVLSVNTNRNPDYKYKEGFFMIGDNYSNVFAIEVSLEQALAFESDKTLKKPLLDRAAECGSIRQAIMERAEEIRSKKKGL